MKNFTTQVKRLINDGIFFLVIISLLFSSIGLPVKVSAASFIDLQSEEVQSQIKGPPLLSKSTAGTQPAFVQTIDYGYDALNRLTSANYTSGPAYSYGYDRNDKFIQEVKNV